MAGLSTYNAKRRFNVTKEPRGKAGKRGHAFVVQKHAATRLHYDLRLQVGGTMKSWAVTRGPSLVPGEKRLAVEVEDHPLDYNRFEGTIPKGEYGGGTVMIWDRGVWRPDIDPEYGLKKGHLAFHLDGEKLHGGWHLVRMHKRPGEKRNNWLLIKQHDDDAREAKDEDILEQQPLSAVTGRTMDEITDGAPRRKRRKATKKATKTKKASKTKKRKRTTARKVKKTARKKSARKPKSRTSRAAATANLALVRTSSTPRHSKAAAKKALSHGRRAALPAFVAPALATLADKPPQSGDWIHEIKFDGYRVQARLDHGKVKLLTRKGLDWTAKFSAIADAVSEIDADTALIDGELVAEDEHGISRFSLLQQDLKAGRGDRMVYYVFDLLHLDGTDLRPLPLTERKEVLAKLAGAKSRGAVRLSESLTEPGPALLRQACKLGLEGIIAKRADAPYRSGRGHGWLKIKCSDRQEFVVAGFMPSTADSRAVGALVLAVNERGKLKYAGRTGTGFTHETARALYRRLTAISRKTSPFEPVPAEERGRRGPVWVEPETVVEVDFRGWTHGDRVRQASYQGVREDKNAGDVVREQPAAAAAAVSATPRKRSAPIKPRKGKETVGQVTLTHPDRVYWEDAGVTKRGLADYYTSVWKWMAPHVAGRPISLLRCPEGAAGQCFFQKHARAGIPEAFLHLVPEKGDKIISIDDLDGLIALVQGGVLEVHVRGSTIDNRERGDRLVFDLDPGPGTGWNEVVAAAREVRERLTRVKLKSFLKTSGGKGLHVVVPIKPAPWATVKRFCHAVALSMEKDEPDKYLATAAKERRKGRIFIDYLRNSREATAVAPYSTRARAGAPVSVPIDWSELGSLKSAAQYTVKNLVQRLSRLKKDPWAAIGRTRQSLPDFK